MDTVFTSASAADGPPDRDAQFLLQSRLSPPDNEVPGALAVDGLLGRGDDIAVALVEAHVYSVGIAFSLIASWRGPEESIGHELFAHRPRFAGAGPASGARLLFGVEFADGRSATNLGARHRHGEGDGPTLNPQGGGGGGQAYRLAFWLHPLPTGDLTVICAWPGRGIDETRTVIPAARIEAARAAVVELWPWEPPPAQESEPEPAPLELPPGGWFATHIDSPPPDRPEGRGWTAYS